MPSDRPEAIAIRQRPDRSVVSGTSSGRLAALDRLSDRHDQDVSHGSGLRDGIRELPEVSISPFRLERGVGAFAFRDSAVCMAGTARPVPDQKPQGNRR